VPIRQSNGSAHVRVLSDHPRFDARSNYIKSNRLRVTYVPNLYLFGTVSAKKPPLIVSATARRFSLRRAYTKPRGEGRAWRPEAVKPRSNITRNLFPGLDSSS
jgi:hypothetical protein